MKRTDDSASAPIITEIEANIQEVLKQLEGLRSDPLILETAGDVRDWEREVQGLTDRLRGLITARAIQRQIDHPAFKEKARKLAQSGPKKMRDQGLRPVTLRLKGAGIFCVASVGIGGWGCLGYTYWKRQTEKYSMPKQRRNFSGGEKMVILREHLIDKTPISEVCERHGLQPTVFYQWQKKLFEDGAAVFEQPRRKSSRQSLAEARKIEMLEAKVREKNEVMAELMGEHVALKKTLGEL